MQQKPPRRTNTARTEATRAALIAAARQLFVEKGFADTGTPEIVAAANVTRGALYHHFSDKTDLFRAVAKAEFESVTKDIEQAANDTSTPSPQQALTDGMSGYFDAMADRGRVRLLLLDGPAVLGAREMREMSAAADGDSLRNGLAAALNTDPASAQITAVSDVLSAAFERAAMAISEGDDRKGYTAAMQCLINGACTAKD